MKRRRSRLLGLALPIKIDLTSLAFCAPGATASPPGHTLALRQIVLTPLDIPFGWKVYLYEKKGERMRRKTVALAWNERPLTRVALHPGV